MATKKNPDLSSGIYFITAKVAQYIQVDKNSREKEEAKMETAKKIATQKLHLQQKLCEDV